MWLHTHAPLFPYPFLSSFSLLAAATKLELRIRLDPLQFDRADQKHVYRLQCLLELFVLQFPGVYFVRYLSLLFCCFQRKSLVSEGETRNLATFTILCQTSQGLCALRGRGKFDKSTCAPRRTHLPIHPLIHSPTHPLTNSPIHLLTHSPTHQFTRINLGANRNQQI